MAHHETAGGRAQSVEPGMLGKPSRDREPSSAAGLTAAAAETIPTAAQSQGTKVLPSEDGLSGSVPARQRRGLRAGAITAGLLTTLGLGWIGGMNTERLAGLDLPGRAAALATAAADETWTQLQAGADSIRTYVKRVGSGSSAESPAPRTAAGHAPGAPGPSNPANGPSISDGRVTELAVKVDQVRAASDEAARDLATRIDQFRDAAEQRNTELTAKLSQIEAQLDRLERQLSTASVPAKAAPSAGHSSTTQPTVPTAAPVQSHTGATEKAAPKPLPSEGKPGEPKVVKNWRVRDVLDGIAILEGPSGVRRVARGDQVPGVGLVETIQRRGKGWAVVTTNGVITAN